MTSEFRARWREKLRAFQLFAEGKSFESCRLVHYAGAGKPNATDVPFNQAEEQISGCLAEGFLVEWSEFNARLYLLVQEPDGPIPPWEKVVAEEAFIDVAAILKEAGLPDA